MYSNDLVCVDLIKRKSRGLEKYGILLDSNTKEDMLQHLYEEILDAAVYLRTLIEQRKLKMDYAKEFNEGYDYRSMELIAEQVAFAFDEPPVEFKKPDPDDEDL